MGVSLTFQGRIGEATDPDDLEASLRAFAHEMEWTVQPFDLSPRQARLGAEVLETPRIRGHVLIPHFACEPVPILPVGDRRVLVDSYVKAEAQDEVRLETEILVKTQFAGPGVHKEVCRFLAESRDWAPGLTVDDETGWFSEPEESRLLEAFHTGWERITAWVRGQRFAPGAGFELGGCPLVQPEPDDVPEEFDRLGPDDRGLVLDLERELCLEHGGFGITFEPGEEGIENLELLMIEAQASGLASDLESPAAESFVHRAGSVFGRSLVAALGGRWIVSEEDGLVLSNLGRAGLEVDPFLVVAQRLVLGPPHGLVLHLRLYQTIAQHLGA
jgi:hypothetical protein